MSQTNEVSIRRLSQEEYETLGRVYYSQREVRDSPANPIDETMLHILLLSAQGHNVTEIAAQVSAGEEVVADTIREFNQWGLYWEPKMPEKKSRLSLSFHFTEAEYERLRQMQFWNFRQDGIDQKWFIYVYKTTVSFCRSWTGVCIYQLVLQPADEGYSVVEAWVNRDPGQYRATDDSRDTKILLMFIDETLRNSERKSPPYLW